MAVNSALIWASGRPSLATPGFRQAQRSYHTTMSPSGALSGSAHPALGNATMLRTLPSLPESRRHSRTNVDAPDEAQSVTMPTPMSSTLVPWRPFGLAGF